jgi:hypothetical protein
MYDVKEQISMSQFQIYAGLSWKPLLLLSIWLIFSLGSMLRFVWGDQPPH